MERCSPCFINGAMESLLSQAVMVIRQSPTTTETKLMNPGMDSMSMAILRPLSLMRATSSITRKEIRNTERTWKGGASIACSNAGAETERADRGGLHDDVKSQGTWYSTTIEISLQGRDLAAFDAGEVGSSERDRAARRWQTHDRTGVGALHEPLG